MLVENSTEIHQISLTYLCTGISGTFVPNEEVSMIDISTQMLLPVFFPGTSRRH